MGMAGRPSKYEMRFVELAYNYCLLGADDAFLANAFEVDEATINRWKTKYPEFCESIKKGKAIADAEIAKSLFKRAKGFIFEEETFERLKKTEETDPQGRPVKSNRSGKLVVVKRVVKYYPPDPISIIYWLNNRQAKYWKNKQPEIKPDTNNKPKPPWLTSDNLEEDGPDE